MFESTLENIRLKFETKSANFFMALMCVLLNLNFVCMNIGSKENIMYVDVVYKNL